MTKQPRDVVRVKALDWEERPATLVASAWEATSFIGPVTYWLEPQVTLEGEVFGYECCLRAEAGMEATYVWCEKVPTEDAAKAACQAHYEELVYNLLEVR